VGPEFYFPPAYLSVQGGQKLEFPLSTVQVQNSTGKLPAKPVGNYVGFTILRSFTPESGSLRPGLVPKKISQKTTVTNLAAHAWSIKCRRKKLIAQLGGKSRDETFKPK
jgi:hypothetical protein